MRILVISDTHGEDYRIKNLIKLIRPDEIYHLGDSQNECQNLIAMANGLLPGMDLEKKIPVACVRGNCDWSSDLADQIVKRVGKHKILLLHGHKQHVNWGPELLASAAMEAEADIVLYGHTHIPRIDTFDGIRMMNPGSLSQPRQDGRVPSYGVINVDSSGEIDMAIRYFEIQ